MQDTLSDSLILETLHNASDLSEDKRTQHAEHLMKLQELCPDTTLHWILQHPAEVFPKIPDHHTDTVCAVLDVIMRIPDFSMFGANINTWKLQYADYALSVTTPVDWIDSAASWDIKECTDEEIIKLISDSPDLAAKSKSSYMSRIRTMQSLFPEKSLQWMVLNPETVSAKVKDSYAEEGSQKAYFVGMKAIMKLNPEMVHQAAATKWKEIIAAVNKAIEIKQNQASVRQQAGYVAWEDVIAARDDLLRSSVEYLYLCCYTMIPPVRADFSNLRIFRKEPEDHEMRESPNYLQIKESSITLVLKEFKTAKTMGDYVNDLPDDLCAVLRHHLKDGREYLFTGRGGEQFQSVQTFTNWSGRLLKRVFKKPCTPTLLRHSYITYLDSSGISSRDRRAQASLLMHNQSRFLQYVFDNID